MGTISQDVREYIKSGEYFTDARKWYSFKYIEPITQRSFLLLSCLTFFILLLIMAANIHSLLPIKEQVRYAIHSDSEKQVNITNANQLSQNPYQAIADIMIKNYVKNRETYNYDLLKQQFIFIQNTSTRIVFMQFSNFMNIDNPLSPLMRYQKSFRRSISISNLSYSQDGEAIVTFESIAKNSTNEILENIVWQATIGFVMDNISLNFTPGSPFNFTVTNYKLKLLKDKSKK